MARRRPRRAVASRAYVVARSHIYWVALDPTVGTEIQKTRPCVVVSPDELNAKLNRVIVAPITSTMYSLPFRIATTVRGRPATVVLDQLRTIDVQRLGNKIGKVDTRTMKDILGALQAMFAP
jgi:mRNA interferase MazF